MVDLLISRSLPTVPPLPAPLAVARAHLSSAAANFFLGREQHLAALLAVRAGFLFPRRASNAAGAWGGAGRGLGRGGGRGGAGQRAALPALSCLVA